jgi:hypothetical protein
VSDFVSIDERFFGIAKASLANITVYDPDSNYQLRNDTIRYVVSSTVSPVPVTIVPWARSLHNFTSFWNVTIPQEAGLVQIFVYVTDSGGLNSSQTCSTFVKFADVNDAPVIDIPERTANVSEKALNGTRLLRLYASDLDLRQQLYFTLAPTDPYVLLSNSRPGDCPVGCCSILPAFRCTSHFVVLVPLLLSGTHPWVCLALRTSLGERRT